MEIWNIDIIVSYTFNYRIDEISRIVKNIIVNLQSPTTFSRKDVFVSLI